MFLIDTHTLLWYLKDSPELSKKSTEIINTEPTIFVSIVSLWEITIKKSIGKLQIDKSISEIEDLCIKKEISILPIKSKHLDYLELLEKIHNDPFDRLLICQAKTEDLCIITKDSIIPSYSVNTIW